MALTRIWGLIFPTITFLASLSFSLLLLFGGRLVLAEKLSIGQFVSFTFYINLLVWPMIATGWVFNLVQRGIASTKRILEILETQPEVTVKSRAHDGTRIGGQYRVPLPYLPVYRKEQPPHCAISCSPSPKDRRSGSSGNPGSGKTTLASLLFHLYPLDRECLFIDGRDINDFPLDTLRQSIAYVPQDSFLFSDTIAANIAFGLDEDEQVQAAIEEAAQLAVNRPGHRQIYRRLRNPDRRTRGHALGRAEAAARASRGRSWPTQARILILDDALSAVDTATEAEILANIRPIIGRRTTLMIAHRISTVRQCDAIIVLDNGRIAEHGTHDELAAAGGFYATLYELQRMKGAGMTTPHFEEDAPSVNLLNIEVARLLFSYLLRYRRHLFNAIVLVAFITAARLIVPWLSGIMVDHYLVKKGFTISTTAAARIETKNVPLHALMKKATVLDDTTMFLFRSEFGRLSSQEISRLKAEGVLSGRRVPSRRARPGAARSRCQTFGRDQEGRHQVFCRRELPLFPTTPPRNLPPAR